ncbi:MAG: hypothetical protein HGGPFJEG_01851 [Ignavibacteria bacterium]|nr:hypothetical protein [Ignavibacteria bacterium]
MKVFKNFLIILLIFVSVSSAFSVNDTIKCKATNFEITNSGTLFSFDVYVLRATPDNFVMGSSSFYFSYASGVFLVGSAYLTNVNPRYSGNSFYNSMLAIHPFNGVVGIQLMYTSGAGEIITNDPGSTGYGERVATINMTIVPPPRPAGLVWNTGESGVVSPTFAAATGVYDGSYNGILPVELASFTSVIYRNTVNLKWETTSEINNSGFEIERKPAKSEEWTKITFINGNGNSNEPKSYNYTDKDLLTGNYNYRLKQIDFNGNFEYFELSNEVNIGVPQQFELSQNYPNPFNPSTKINFSLPEDGKVKLDVFDVSGRHVKTLINNEFKTANYYTVEFSGANLSSGTYFYTIQSGNRVETRKMMLVK